MAGTVNLSARARFPVRLRQLVDGLPKRLDAPGGLVRRDGGKAKPDARARLRRRRKENIPRLDENPPAARYQRKLCRVNALGCTHPNGRTPRMVSECFNLSAFWRCV